MACHQIATPNVMDASASHPYPYRDSALRADVPKSRAMPWRDGKDLVVVAITVASETAKASSPRNRPARTERKYPTLTVMTASMLSMFSTRHIAGDKRVCMCV